MDQNEAHPLGDDYEIWCELNPCPQCQGDGEIEAEDGHTDTCGVCDGVGIDPAAEYQSDFGGSAVL